MSLLLNAAAGLALAAYTDAEFGVRSDLRLGYAFARASLKHALRHFRSRPSLFHFFDDTANANPDGIAYVYHGKPTTWREAQAQARRLAHFLLGQGLRSGGMFSFFFFFFLFIYLCIYVFIYLVIYLFILVFYHSRSG